MTSTQAERLARAGERVGKVLKVKYRLDRVLGVGGMASVYAATHLRNASRVAVKVLHREMAADENVRARFLREGYAANSVEHSGTVRILDDDTAEDGSVFLVMELLEGETLDARWERSGHRLNAREVARLLYKLLDVLAAAHAKGIVHRDIKPENLFLTREGAVKVLDFGVARLIELPVTSTRPGGIVGTPAFMAPEQVLGQTVDAQSDLWSAGATAFTLLARCFVHEAETPQAMMVAVGSRPARSLELVAPDVPIALARVVDRALKFDKIDRWPDARAMQHALADSYMASFGAPMPGTEDADDGGALSLADAASGDVDPVRRFDRSSAVTVLTGATPVVAVPPEPIPPGALPMARRRPSRSTLVAAGAALLTVAIGVVVAVTAAEPSSPATVVTVGASREAPAASSAPAPAPRPRPRSAAAVPRALTAEPPSFPVESLPAVREAPAVTTAPAPAPPPPASARPARPAPARAPADCSPPFTTDPDTGKKKWKLECL